MGSRKIRRTARCPGYGFRWRSNTASIAVHFDSTGLLPGLRQAQFTFSTDTPNKVPAMPLTLTVQFLDVPDDNQFQSFIYGAAGAGVMIGGPPNCPGGVFYFCPAGIVTRADMAGYLCRGVHGASTPPPVYQNIFLDVTFNQYNSFYIQGVYDDGIAAGCSSSPALYCPDIPVTRAQMSALIWKGMFGEPGAAGMHRSLRRRPLSVPLRRLHRRALQPGDHRGMRQREFLSEPPDQERPDGDLPREVVQPPVPAVRQPASDLTGAAQAAPVSFWALDYPCLRALPRVPLRSPPSCWRPLRARRIRRLPLLLLTLDTTRADYVGRTIAGSSLTPSLDAPCAGRHALLHALAPHP